MSEDIKKIKAIPEFKANYTTSFTLYNIKM